MARGLKVPVTANRSGGFAFSDGDDNDRKIIKLALGSDENENAFQQGEDVALGQGMIFDLSDPAVRARIRRRLFRLFDNFEAQNRFKLLKDTIKWTEDLGEQELILEFKYLSIESDEIKEFDKRFSAAS